MTDAAVPVRSAKVTARGITEHARTIPAEVPVAFVYDGTTHAVMMASPTDLEDFAVGFSLAEGIIGAPEDIQSLDIVEQDKGIELRAWLVPDRGRKLAQRRRNLAGPTGCGLCGVESLEAAVPCCPHVAADATVTAADIAAAQAALERAQVLNRAYPRRAWRRLLDQGQGARRHRRGCRPAQCSRQAARCVCAATACRLPTASCC